VVKSEGKECSRGGMRGGGGGGGGGGMNQILGRVVKTD